MAPTGSKEITPRDVQVLKWVALGLERNDVAETLGTSRSAINRHMAKVMRLTATSNNAAAVAYVMALGILRAQDVTTLTRKARMDQANLLAPNVIKRAPLNDAGVSRADVAQWLRSERLPAPDCETEQHLNEVLERLAWEFETGRAEIKGGGQA